MICASDEGNFSPLEVSPEGCPTAFLLSNFDIGCATLKTGHKKFLLAVVEILSSDGSQVELVGRASRSGPERFNLQLSRKRAEAVASFLRQEGVAAEQISVRALGEQAPLSTANEAEEDRSVEVRPKLAKEVTLVLVDVGMVRRAKVLEQTIQDALGSLARRAGRELEIARSLGMTVGDLTLTFDRSVRETRPCGLLILGNEGGGDVFVGAMEDLRVCGGPQGDPGDPDYASQIERVFDPDEPEFARAVGNTAVHELGHMIAKLEHTEDPNNFMYSVGSLGANLPRERRTRAAMRRHWARRLSFTDDQAKRLVCAMQTGYFAGGMRSKSIPGAYKAPPRLVRPHPSPSSKK
jgi:hypothetical protein